MNSSLTFFVFFIFLGILLRHKLPPRLQSLSKATAYYILLIFISLSFWKIGLPAQAFVLFMLGVLLHAIPVLIGLYIRHPIHQSFFLFGTYGGGSRGVLALSIISPALLPIFILIDLGNFIALILLYPFLLRIKQNKQQKTKLKDGLPLFLSIASIGSGLLLHNHANLEFADKAHATIKVLLISITSFHVGTHLQLNKECLLWTLKNMLIVRFSTLLISITFYLVFLPPEPEILWIILLFAILPTSSLATSLLPTSTNSRFQAKLSCSVVASSLIYVILISLFMSIHQYIN